MSTRKDKQAEVLNVIRTHLADKEYPPTRREIARRCGIGVQKVQRTLEELVDAGLIEVDPHIDRGIRVKGANMKAVTEEMT